MTRIERILDKAEGLALDDILVSGSTNFTKYDATCNLIDILWMLLCRTD